MTLSITPSAQANVSWSFNSGSGGCIQNCTNNSNNSNYYRNVYSFGSSSNQVTVSAFSTTEDQGGRDAFETSHLAQYNGGLGVRSQDDLSYSPYHAIDNNGDTPSGDGGDVDAVQFSFDEGISLSDVNIGWRSGDSDITVMAHDGSGDKSLVGKTFAELLSSGWSLIGHYSNLQVNANEAINATNVFSSDWLITAYTPEAGGEQGGTFGNDFFKLAGVSGDVADPGQGGSVPEPSSIVILLLGFIGWKISNNGSRAIFSNREELLVA